MAKTMTRVGRASASKACGRDWSPSFVQQRALFLDRDGVINVNHGYVHRSEDFEFIDGIFDVARSARAANYKLVIISNQAGIGRGYYSEQEFHELTVWMCGEFENVGAPIDKVYYSPFHPTAGLGAFRKDDASRKPRPGMILQAQHELDLDLKRSVLIGDKPTDIQAGVAAGVGSNILFAQTRPMELSGLHFHLIASLHEAMAFLTD